MRIEIWFDNSNSEAMMRCFPHVDENSVNKKDGKLYFNSATSDHRFEVNLNHVLFIEYMPTEKK